MKVRSTMLALVACALTLAFAVPRASAAPHAGFLPVSQTLSNGGVLSGLKITHVTPTANGNFLASGIAAVTTSTGTVIAPFSDAPLSVTDPSCPILNLVVGPINLDLLGLKVTTNQITINITAQSGPGNLLGNLLCDVANLLNQNPLNLNRIADLLNQILGSL